jgi:hypothetical protein
MRNRKNGIWNRAVALLLGWNIIPASALEINSSANAETTTVNNFNYCRGKISHVYQDQDNNFQIILTLSFTATTAVLQKLHQPHQPHTWATKAFQIIYFGNRHPQQHQRQHWHWCRMGHPNTPKLIIIILTLALMAQTAVPQQLHQWHHPHTLATQAFQITWLLAIILPGHIKFPYISIFRTPLTFQGRSWFHDPPPPN